MGEIETLFDQVNELFAHLSMVEKSLDQALPPLGELLADAGEAHLTASRLPAG